MTSFRSEADQSAEGIRSATFEWRGIGLEVQFHPDWLGMGERKGDFGYGVAHLEIRAMASERAPLPITETSYLSHFLGRGVVE